MNQFNMTDFEQFKEKFDKTYKNVWEFMCDYEEDKNPLNYVLENDISVYNRDSYGADDSVLKMIFCFPDFNNILVLFYGTRQSYVGTEWEGMKEVKKIQKTIDVYE